MDSIKRESNPPLPPNVKTLQLSSIFHGSAALLIGLLAGIGLTYSALGEISLWPIFSTPINMPGDIALWRAAHTGSITNGIACIAAGLSLNLLSLPLPTARRICFSLKIMVWGNIIFYIARLWGTNRGLALHSEQFGTGNMFDVASMLPAFAAIFFTFYAFVTLMLSSRKK
ncbi:hypothetical protein R50073_25530 [Maricurvus nonylphenolicus]|uniref:hypothetical protein n=1 Tax=Maricurvus nonylphenolicus TaxID=1008307 RepID=UPI0036F1EA97